MEALTGVLGGLTNNFVIEQIVGFNLAGTVINSALTPYLQALTNTVNSTSPNVPLTPADLALAVIRNIMDEPTAAQEARSSGIAPDRFAKLVLLTGDAPAPGELAEGLRRGLIDLATYQKGIRQGRLRDEWSDFVRQIAIRNPSPNDAMTALVEGQLSEPDARTKYAEFGGNPAEFDWLFGTVGSGPSPVEAGMMANRGIIPWGGKGLGVVSFEQAIAEGHSRNKWEPAWRAIAEPLPPARTIVAMYKEGGFTEAQAAKLLAEHGFSAEMVAAYIKSASATKTGRTKELAESTVLALYDDKLVDRATAKGMIVKLGYSDPEAEFILEVADLRLAERFLRGAVTRVHTLYVGHKIDHTTASSLLAEFGVPAGNIDAIMVIWDHEREANIRRLTEAQIVDAWHLEIIDQDTAEAELVGLGYSAADALILLAIKNKGKLPAPPAGP